MRKSFIFIVITAILSIGATGLASAHDNKHLWSLSVYGNGWQGAYVNQYPRYVYPSPVFIEQVPVQRFYIPQAQPVFVQPMQSYQQRARELVTFCHYNDVPDQDGNIIRVYDRCWKEWK